MRCCDCEYRNECNHKEFDIVGFESCGRRTKMNLEKGKKFAEDALNEKSERDFGELMRWKNGNDDNCATCVCPKCQSYYSLEELPWWRDKNKYNYCPNCGQRLLPPEEDL